MISWILLILYIALFCVCFLFPAGLIVFIMYRQIKRQTELEEERKYLIENPDWVYVYDKKTGNIQMVLMKDLDKDEKR